MSFLYIFQQLCLEKVIYLSGEIISGIFVETEQNMLFYLFCF